MDRFVFLALSFWDHFSKSTRYIFKTSCLGLPYDRHKVTNFMDYKMIKGNYETHYAIGMKYELCMQNATEL